MYCSVRFSILCMYVTMNNTLSCVKLKHVFRCFSNGVWGYPGGRGGGCSFAQKASDITCS